MKICANNHPAVVFSEYDFAGFEVSCPLCKALEEIEGCQRGLKIALDMEEDCCCAPDQDRFTSMCIHCQIKEVLKTK